MVEPAKKSTTSNSFQGHLGEFQVLMKLSDSDLLIEAEHSFNGRLYQLSLTDESIPTISTNLLSTIG
mgnify:CR=1 FL=1